MDAFQPPSLAHVKSKKVKELASLRWQQYALQNQLQHLQKTRVAASPPTLLAWREIANALKDDTTEQLATNKALQRQRRRYQRLCDYLQRWVASTTPRLRSPSPFVEGWRHSHLFAGDEGARALSYNWLLQQVYRTTDRVFATLVFPNGRHNAIDVSVTIHDEMRLVIHVQTQQVVPFALEDVSRGLWIAQDTLCQELFASPDDPSTLLSLPSDDVQYTRENVGRAMAHNVLTGRFHEPHRTVICLRSILHDDAHLTSPQTWRFDNKEWNVAEMLEPRLTRVRTYYTIDHPCTVDGYVSLRDLAALRCLDSNECDDRAHLLARLERISIDKHIEQRQFFMQHLERTLRALTRHESQIPRRGVLAACPAGS
ncbi:hypothetical protein SPRG_16390 [Saprolegnia parasitica CBS 223.65]|uniref:Uncharacterized protein n=1 Tax=Saprolegnia parasitica (strain CBS 223.65) TaxID=695850 RepID=A0A067BIJ6_SAPPC|nr:hypothetical protein SPRG_16390 [Saprolegnia parasitica CBS 223.65]KDO18194.1 hypothetical protein SPRG_16390 [Saprolegnia parasitica CBS 223.65]|eukprot:XP_012211091.1 hypothetical protein SPRG_16390 [Saprolegnia parasitica CBS 223.65]